MINGLNCRANEKVLANLVDRVETLENNSSGGGTTPTPTPVTSIPNYFGYFEDYELIMPIAWNLETFDVTIFKNRLNDDISSYSSYPDTIISPEQGSSGGITGWYYDYNSKYGGVVLDFGKTKNDLMNLLESDDIFSFSFSDNDNNMFLTPQKIANINWTNYNSRTIRFTYVGDTTEIIKYDVNDSSIVTAHFRVVPVFTSEIIQ